MRRWKRLLLCLPIAAAVGFGLWSGLRRPSPAGFSLALLGYTNGYALLSATNSGPVPVRVHSLRSIIAFKNDDVRVFPASIHSATGFPSSLSLPQIIGPRGSLTFATPVPPESHSWAVTAVFEGWGARDRTYAWARRTGNATTRRWMYQLLSEPKYINITFNAPTNQSAIKVGADAINQGGNERH